MLVNGKRRVAGGRGGEAIKCHSNRTLFLGWSRGEGKEIALQLTTVRTLCFPPFSTGKVLFLKIKNFFVSRIFKNYLD